LVIDFDPGTFTVASIGPDAKGAAHVNWGSVGAAPCALVLRVDPEEAG
jgi:hypothetical protein